MIVKLQLDQVSALWDVIAEGIVKSNVVPLKNQLDFTNRCLQDIMTGDVQCWVLFTGEDEQKVIHAVQTTRITYNRLYDYNRITL